MARFFGYLTDFVEDGRIELVSDHDELGDVLSTVLERHAAHVTTYREVTDRIARGGSPRLGDVSSAIGRLFVGTAARGSDTFVVASPLVSAVANQCHVLVTENRRHDALLGLNRPVRIRSLRQFIFDDLLVDAVR